MLNIHLINPPQSSSFPQLPMGLALIASILEKDGHRVRIIDANALRLGPDDIVRETAAADVIGLTATTPTAITALELARHLKKANPQRPIILGGAHASLLPEATMARAPEIDYIVNGEGETTVCELMRCLENGGDPAGIAGIYHRVSGKVCATARREELTDMDGLPFLAYHLLPMKKYHPHPPHGRAHPWTAMITSRGCPYHCAYCSKPVFGNRFRAQSPERVIEEIIYLQKRFGVREIAFYDDVFTLDKKRVAGICEMMISRGIKLQWSCESRVNLVDEELLKLMARAGCHAISYGIESAAPEILDALHKGVTVEQVTPAIAATRRAGIQAIGYFMLGAPGETPQTARQTIDFSKELKLDFAQFSITTPFPGTELYELLGEKGKDIPWESFVYSAADSQMIPLFDNSALSKEELKRWTRRAYREFYLRPAYFWQRLKRLNSWGELRVNIAGLKMLKGSA